MALTPGFTNYGAFTPAGATSVQAMAQVDVLGNTVTPGGSATVAIAASKTANTVVKASAGRLCRVLVTVVGTVDLKIYDNATTTSGTVIGYIPAAAVLGASYDIQMPAATGITVGGNASNAGITVSFY
jgi:hypothetical protein